MLQNAAGQVQKPSDSVPLDTCEKAGDDNNGGSTSILIDLGETQDVVTPPKEKPEPKQPVKAAADTTISVANVPSQQPMVKRKAKAIRK